MEHGVLMLNGMLYVQHYIAHHSAAYFDDYVDSWTGHLKGQEAVVTMTRRIRRFIQLDLGRI